MEKVIWSALQNGRLLIQARHCNSGCISMTAGNGLK